MCGIVGYTGPREAYRIMIKGLQRLEYRGYDSTGVALKNVSALKVYKKKGKVKDLENELKDKELHARIGIGHTRWATHGEPNDVNAHPHYSQSGRFAIIHNGIIENYATIKQVLLKKEYRNYTEKYWDKRVLAPSSLLFYLGVKKPLPKLQHHTLFFDEPFGPHAQEIYVTPKWPKNPLFYVCRTTATDKSVAPENCEN